MQRSSRCCARGGEARPRAPCRALRMCLILVAWKVHADFPLVVAANRDEFHARPAARAAFWHDQPDDSRGPRPAGQGHLAGRLARRPVRRGHQLSRRHRARRGRVARGAGHAVSAVDGRAGDYVEAQGGRTAASTCSPPTARSSGGCRTATASRAGWSPAATALGNLLLDTPDVEEHKQRFRRRPVAIEPLFGAAGAREDRGDGATARAAPRCCWRGDGRCSFAERAFDAATARTAGDAALRIRSALELLAHLLVQDAGFLVDLALGHEAVLAVELGRVQSAPRAPLPHARACAPRAMQRARGSRRRRPCAATPSAPPCGRCGRRAAGARCRPPCRRRRRRARARIAASFSSSSISGGTLCSSTNTLGGCGWLRRARLLPVHAVRFGAWRESIIRAHEKSVERRRGRAIFAARSACASTPRACSGATSRWCCTAAATPRSSSREKNLFGEDEDVLYVKGSGWDLETIEAAGFAPVQLDYVRRLAPLPALSDPQMVNELATHTLRAGAPAPSVETILHAILPHKYVDHTHADAVLSVTNTPDGEQRIRDIYGDTVVVIPYVMPGFDLARALRARIPEAGGRKAPIGMVLLKHGIFSFGADARESYERMIELVSMAERYLDGEEGLEHRPAARRRARLQARRGGEAAPRRLARRRASRCCACATTAPRFLGFARHPDVARISQRGPGHARPRHPHQAACRCSGATWPAYGAAYRSYFEQQCAAGQGAQDHARSGAAHGARSASSAWPRSGARAKDAAHRRGALRAHHRGDPARRGARRLAGAAGEAHLRRRVLGPGAGQAEEGRQRRPRSPARWRWSPARPRASARPAWRRSSRAAPRWSGSTSIPRSRRCSSGQDFLGLALRPDRRSARSQRRWSARSSASAASTCWC